MSTREEVIRLFIITRPLGKFNNRRGGGKLSFREFKYLTSGKQKPWNWVPHVLNLVFHLINLITTAVTI